MITFLIFLVYMCYGFKVVKDDPDAILFVAMMTESNPVLGVFAFFGLVLIWPYIKWFS